MWILGAEGSRILKKDVRNVLRHLQLLDGEMESVDMTPG